MTAKETGVYDWRFETGEPEEVGVSVIYPTGFRDGFPRGWYCAVYPENETLFTDWMTMNCPTADVVHRFNSGDPMWTVHITSEAEAALFVLRWL